MTVHDTRELIMSLQGVTEIVINLVGSGSAAGCGFICVQGFNAQIRIREFLMLGFCAVSLIIRFNAFRF